MRRVLSSLHPPTEYVQVAYVETLSGLTKVQLAVTQVNMVKTLECQCLQSQRQGAECRKWHRSLPRVLQRSVGGSDTVAAV